MDKATLQAMLACLLWISQIPTSVALSSDTEKAVRAATFEFRAPASEVHSKDLVGSAFAIGANEFVSAAHLFDRAIGSHFGHPVLMDLSHREYRVADILQFSEQQDYVVFSLERPPRVKPLPIQQSEHTEPDLYFAGWRSDGRIVIDHGTFSGVTRDKESGQADWLRFSGPLWGGIGGGPLLDSSGRVVGIVQARARNGDANYAVPVGVLPLEGPGRAHIHAMEMLRSLMPVVSSVTPLEADIPLPMSFDRFARELGQLRLEYFEREIGPLLEATRRNFVLRGDGAADVCNLLNGKSCECRPRAGVSGVLVVDDAGANELVRQVGTERDVSQKIAGAVLLRIPEDGGTRARRRDLSSDPLLHLNLALKGQVGLDPSLEESARTAQRPAADDDRLYVDFHDRTWQMRTWPLLNQDLELVSLARKLPDGYVVLTRTVPAALGYAAQLQLKVLANLVYYACDELPGEGIAVMADTLHR